MVSDHRHECETCEQLLLQVLWHAAAQTSRAHTACRCPSLVRTMPRHSKFCTFPHQVSQFVPQGFVCTAGCATTCVVRGFHTLVTMQRTRPYATTYFATGSVHRPLCSTCLREPQANCCRDLPQVHRRPGPCNCGMFSCAQDHCCQHRCC